MSSKKKEVGLTSGAKEAKKQTTPLSLCFRVTLAILVTSLLTPLLLTFFLSESANHDWEPKLTSSSLSSWAKQNGIKFSRRDSVVHIFADNQLALSWAMGYIHAHERYVQMVFTRTIAQGRLSEIFASDEETLAIDTFMRESGFADDCNHDKRELPSNVLDLGYSYSYGVNNYTQEHGLPFEFDLLGVKPEPWDICDSMAIGQLMCFLSLAENQRTVENLILNSIQKGVPVSFFKHLFSPFLDDLDDETVELIKKVKIEQSKKYFFSSLSPLSPLFFFLFVITLF